MDVINNTSISGRCWVATIQECNMRASGLTEEEYKKPDILAHHFTKIWENSGSGRKAAIAVCMSNKGCYHAHMACYGNTTTLNTVAKVLFNSHVETQKGTKKQLTDYFIKDGKYKSQNNEKVLYTLGLENIQDRQGKILHSENIQDLINQGLSPKDIFYNNFNYRRQAKEIYQAHLDKRLKDTPIIKNMKVYWHTGESGSGKSYFYLTLCNKHGEENIYMINDLQNGDFDNYIVNGSPNILFIDDLKDEIKYKQLLTTLDVYSRTQTHCRYVNAYNLWTEVHITSIFPPEGIYERLIPEELREQDSLKQLIRRITYIVYHYVEKGKYKSYSMPSSQYINYDDLKAKALADNEGFLKVTDISQIPFEQS